MQKTKKSKKEKLFYAENYYTEASALEVHPELFLDSQEYNVDEEFSAIAKDYNNCLSYLNIPIVSDKQIPLLINQISWCLSYLLYRASREFLDWQEKNLCKIDAFIKEYEQIFEKKISLKRTPQFNLAKSSFDILINIVYMPHITYLSVILAIGVKVIGFIKDVTSLPFYGSYIKEEIKQSEIEDRKNGLKKLFNFVHERNIQCLTLLDSLRKESKEYHEALAVIEESLVDNMRYLDENSILVEQEQQVSDEENEELSQMLKEMNEMTLEDTAVNSQINSNTVRI